MSNHWYVPALRVSKMAIVATIFLLMEVVFFFFPLCNLSENIRKSTKWFLESCRKSRPSPFQKIKAYTTASSLVLELLEHGSRNIVN